MSFYSTVSIQIRGSLESVVQLKGMLRAIASEDMDFDLRVQAFRTLLGAPLGLSHDGSESDDGSDWSEAWPWLDLWLEAPSGLVFGKEQAHMGDVGTLQFTLEQSGLGYILLCSEGFEDDGSMEAYYPSENQRYSVALDSRGNPQILLSDLVNAKAEGDLRAIVESADKATGKALPPLCASAGVRAFVARLLRWASSVEDRSVGVA